MTHYFCIATGQEDCLPNRQEFHAVDTYKEFKEIVDSACLEFEIQDAEIFWSSDRQSKSAGFLPVRYVFRMPREGENNYSQRVCISRFSDEVLDVIGMTESDYMRETLGEGN